VKIPGSKSILQRLMLLLAYTQSEMSIQNYNPCDDVMELEAALKSYGYRVTQRAQSRDFCFDKALCATSKHHYVFRHSATAFRLWLSFLAAQEGVVSQVWVSDILLYRGYAPLKQALEAMGAKLYLNGNSMEIHGCQLQGGHHHLAGNISSQYASSLILAAPFMKNPLQLKLSPFQVSQSYIKLSLQLLGLFGGKAQVLGHDLRICNQSLRLPSSFKVDSDLSTIAYYAARAALIPPGQRLPSYRNPQLIQADECIFDFLKQMGAGVRKIKNHVQVNSATLQGSTFELRNCPDLMPILAILALFCEGPSTLNGIGRLIYKESNRLQGICTAFDKIGVKYQLESDRLSISPLTHEPEAVILDTQQDHRLVMAFSLLAARFPQIELSETKSLSKSFPFGYQELLK